MLVDFYHKLDSILSTGDPTVRQWFLIKKMYQPILLCTLYVIFVTLIGPALMRNRKPFKLRRLMIFFNCAIVATYLYELAIVMIYLPRIPFHIFCYGSTLEKHNPAYPLALAAWVIYLLKYVEFLDTIFFVLRKKQNHISFLHVIHHTVVPLLGFVLIRTEKSGMMGLPAILNGLVHIIMYSYYGLAAMGPHVRKYLWWKKYLTQLQMIQFVLMIVFLTVIAPMSGCSIVQFSLGFYIFFALLFLVLFYQFYRSNFKSESEQERCKAPEVLKQEAEITKASKVRKSVNSSGVYCNGNCS